RPDPAHPLLLGEHLLVHPPLLLQPRRRVGAERIDLRSGHRLVRPGPHQPGDGDAQPAGDHRPRVRALPTQHPQPLRRITLQRGQFLTGQPGCLELFRCSRKVDPQPLRRGDRLHPLQRTHLYSTCPDRCGASLRHPGPATALGVPPWGLLTLICEVWHRGYPVGMPDAVFRLGFVPGVTPAKWVRPWRQRHGMPLELVPLTHPTGAAALSDGTVDAALLRPPVDHETVSAIPLYTEVTVVLAPKDHPLAALEP